MFNDKKSAKSLWCALCGFIWTRKDAACVIRDHDL